jgi:phi13 family phage major tail protein
MSDEVMGEILSCDSLYMAKIILDTADNYTTGTPEYLAPLGEVKHDPKVNSASSDYDGHTMFNYYTEAGEDTLTISGLSEKRKAQITGKSYDPATGRIYDSGDLSRVPDYAVGYRIEIGSGVYVYRWFLKGNFQIGSMTAKSKGQKVDPQGTELTFIPLNTIHKWTIPDPKNASGTILASQKAVVADTSDPAFTTADAWFAQVQTPTAGGAISPLSAVSVPANNAAAVVATSTQKLTFSNAISEDAVVLMKASDNSIVDVTKSYDVASKVLTITPLASLTSAGIYNIVIAGVKDIYGQSLAPSVIKFTVA